MLINIPLAWEFSGGPASWTWHSHPGGPGLTLGWGTDIPQAMLHGQGKQERKGNEKKGK